MNAIRFIRKTLTLDYRSLALYRMLMGVIVMADVLYRLPDAINLYTDQGIVPRATFISEMTLPWSLSFHLGNGSTGFILVMLALHFLAGLALFVGFKSRFAVFVAWILTVSLHNRNWLVNNGGDDILRVILFLSIFLPLNRCFSLDSALERPKEKGKEGFFSFWSLSFFFQVFAIYFVSYLLKDHPIWRKDFTAFFFSSRLDIFATPIGVWLRDFPAFQKLTTIFTVYLEMLGPLLLVCAFAFGKFWWIVRLIVVALFWGFHIGIIFTMWIGVFPYLCLVMWLIFLPGPLWDWGQDYFRKKDYGKLTIYFDAECGLCQKLVFILSEFFLLPEVKIKEAQSVKAVYAQMQEKHSWVVENEHGHRFFYYEAMMEVWRHSPFLKWLVPLFSMPLMARIGGPLYSWISQHRLLLGKMTQFLTYHSPYKRIWTFFWIKELFGAFILTTIVMWNLTTIKKWNIKAPFFQNTARWLHLYQEWNMFAPFPKLDNVWVEIPAILEDGSQLELLTGDRDIFSVKKEVFPHVIPNEHWRKFYLNLAEKVEYSRYYGGYLCRQWNQRKIRLVKDQTLRKMEIIVYSQSNLPNGDVGSINKKISWKHWCFEEELKRDNPPKTTN